MTDIFISYVRETEAEAQRIVEALRGRPCIDGWRILANLARR
jgi:hypothetical protein